MNKLTIVAIAALSAVTFGVSGAIAQAGGDFAKADGNKDGKVDMTEATAIYPALTQAQFDAADTNKDGGLDEAEFGTLAGTGLTQNQNGSSSAASDASSGGGSSSSAM